MICTGETYKAAMKLTFANGAEIDDPARLFNSSLEWNVRRAIEFHEGDEINGVCVHRNLFARLLHSIWRRKRSEPSLDHA